MSEPSSHLADQALANLVDQFARPLDFLRELAQNSIDAGSPRIEVRLDWAADPADPGQGVLQIHVDDFGEGMDEAVIDDQLTRLFASSKEDDLTKIGKFGIGFTSIFAIRPEAVLLRTGKHGEFWELLFHADRSFDKVRIQEPVAGTKITLYKRLPAADLPAFASEARFVLGYWCEHSDVPITWWDRTSGPAPAPAPTNDPFAAFSDPSPGSGPETVNRPLALDDADLSVHLRDGDVELVVGFCDPPRYGFYNGGLTLLASRSPDCLGAFEPALRHVSFKAKHDRLEHTLTRDNVLQDEHWTLVMKRVEAGRQRLVEALLDRAAAAVTAGQDLQTWHRWLARDRASLPEARRHDGLADRILFRDTGGNALTLDQVHDQERALGFVLFASGNPRLDEAVAATGLHLLPDTAAGRQLLAATTRAPMFEFLRGSRTTRRADEAFVLPEVLDPGVLDADERALVDRTAALLGHALGLRLPVPATSKVLAWVPSAGSLASRIGVRVGDFGGIDLGTDDVLALNGPASATVFLRPDPGWSVVPAFLRWRTLLVNRNHPLFRTQALAAGEDPDLAAFGLAQALLVAEGVEPDRTHRWLLEGTLDELGVEARR